MAFIGNPIIVTVTPGSVSPDAVFHRVRLKVNVTGSGSGTFEFSSPAEDSYIDFDISSALCAVADTFMFTATPGSYPSFGYTATSYDDYMVDGVVETQLNGTFSDSGFYIGAKSDKERLFGGPSSFSRKPTSSPEVCFYRPNQQGESDGRSKHLVPGSTSSSPSVTAVSVSAGFVSGIYGIPQPQDGYEIRFINGLGVHENVFVNCLRTAEVAITTERHIRARQETMSYLSHGITVKKNNHERWKMSSGPLDRQWQEWYLHEFLTARWAWIGVGGNYYQVHILPEETTRGIDRASGNPLTVDFTIEFDINGSPFL